MVCAFFCKEKLVAFVVKIWDFESQQTCSLLSCLKITESFLKLPPEAWSENEEYKQEKERQLRVVNDTAQRGMKLFEYFNQLITNNEEEKEFLLQLVKANQNAEHSNYKKICY